MTVAERQPDARRRRVLFWLPFAVTTVLALVWSFRPQPVPVDMVEITRGTLEVSVSDEGRTRVRNVYTVSAPVGGVMQRITLKAGDAVVAGDTVIARIEPGDPAFLDARSESEALAAVRRAEAERDFARAEVERYRALAQSRTVSASELDAAERRARMAGAALDEARARLLAPSEVRRRQRTDCDCIDVSSPISGSVLGVLRESEGVVASGTPLVEVGDPQDIEVVVDLLSADAVRIRPGMAVRIDAWGGGTPLGGRVRRIEPSGFTKVSALGIEEQRVNVLIDFDGSADERAQLGHGYRVEPRILLAAAHDVVKAPRAALFRDDDGRWAVFVSEGGRARLRTVEIGIGNGLEAEITRGLDAGQVVVLQPGDRVREGVGLRPRQ